METINIPLLRDILTEKRFNEGDMTTNYLPETYPDGFHGKQKNDQEAADLAVITAVISAKNALRSKVLNDSR